MNRCRAIKVLMFMAVLFTCLEIASANCYAANSFALIICGSGGEEEFSKEFADLGNRIRGTFQTKFNFPSDHVFLMTESEDTATSKTEVSKLDSIRTRIGEIAKQMTDKHDLYLILIGHGSYVDQKSAFNVPGPDLVSSELKTMLEGIKVRNFVMVSGASCSAGFINELSGPNRIICTATKSVEENNAPFFMRFFVQALEEGGADTNRDERISVLEACRQASSLTQVHYQAEGWIETEHAILDDNGDGLGSRLVEIELGKANDTDNADEPQDGALAARSYIKDFSFPPSVPQPLVERYLSLLEQVERLKNSKKKLDSDTFYTQLEHLMVEASKVNREIDGIIESLRIESEGVVHVMPNPSEARR